MYRLDESTIHICIKKWILQELFFLQIARQDDKINIEIYFFVFILEKIQVYELKNTVSTWIENNV